MFDEKEFKERFLKEGNLHLRKYVQSVVIIGFIFYPMVFLVDWLTKPQEVLFKYGMIRAFVSLSFIFIGTFNYLQKDGRYSKWWGMLAISLATIGVSFMTFIYGGFSSNYYVGLMSVLYISGLFIPWKPLDTFIYTSLNVAFYMLGNLYFYGFSVDLVMPLAFFITCISFTTLSCFLDNKNRMSSLKTTMEVEKLSETKSQFFANISHELRTPLTLILAGTESLSNRDLSSGDREVLNSIRKNANRLLRQVNNILELTKGDAQEYQLKLVDSNLGRLGQDIIEVSKAKIKQKEISVIITGQENIPNSRFDMEKMEVVFSNLISNAIKFTQSGQIKIAFKFENEVIIVQISDTGKGISEADQKNIFERFKQVDSTQSRENFGTGIGLSLVKDFIELHDGTIKLESELKVGTTFTLTIPFLETFGSNLSRSSQKSNVHLADVGIEEGLIGEDDIIKLEKQNQAVLNQNSKKPLLLYVEDNADLRDYLYKELSDEYRVLLAYHGKDGLDKIRLNRPDIILSDQMMPTMTGVELCGKVKSSSDTSDIPFVLLTARAALDDKVHSFASGVDDYIPKPFSLDELKARLQAQLRIKAMYQTVLEIDKSEALKEITGRLAHEINNPLCIAQMSTQSIEKKLDPQNADEIVNLIGKTQRSIERIAEFVTQLQEEHHHKKAK